MSDGIVSIRVTNITIIMIILLHNTSFLRPYSPSSLLDQEYKKTLIGKHEVLQAAVCSL